MDKNKILDLLKKLVSYNSIFPNEQKLTNYLYHFFKKENFSLKKQKVDDNRFNLLVKKGGAKKSILLYAHLDTVDSTSKNWKTNPFILTIKKDKAYGLGAFDMKGGMVVNIATFIENNLKNWNLKLAFCVDEENISQGAYKLVNSSFIKDVKVIISTEPAFYYGNQGIVIGRPGRAVYQVILQYPSIHYGLYQEKNDLSIILSQFINQLKKINRFKKDKKQFAFIREIKTETIGLSTISKINLEIDTSILPPENKETIEKKISSYLESLQKKYPLFNYQVFLKSRKTPYLDGYQIKNNNYFLRLLKKSVYEVTKKQPTAYFRSSIADENLFGFLGFNVFGIGPIGGNAHNGNEWVSIKSLIILKKIINIFLKKIDEK